MIATRDRAESLAGTLQRISEMPERPPIVVVDNGSTDATAATVRAWAPAAELIELGENRGAAARNVGVTAAATPYVAFCDDDSWWAPGALAATERLLDAHPRVAVVAARVLVGAAQRLDPTCAAMAASPLPGGGAPYLPRVLGFVACGAVVRREAFLEVGGFEPRLDIGGEEELLAIDLAAAGHELVYAERVVAHHHPAGGSRPGRAHRMLRNGLVVAWLRRSPAGALRRSRRLLGAAVGAREALLGLAGAMRRLPWIVRDRRPVRPDLERALRELD